MRERWRSWQATPSLMRRWLLEAAWELARAQIVVRFALRRTLPSLLEPRTASDPKPPEQVERDLRYILHLAAASVPWRSVCLPNAIAARRMLARRGFRSTLHLGVGFRNPHDMHAHAWLEAGGLIITGEDSMDTVTPLPPPSWPARSTEA